MDREGLSAWIRSYEELWRTPGTDRPAEIFSSEVRYSMGPYEEPVEGLQALGDLWERERASADEDFTMTAEIVAVEGDAGVARVEVLYGPPRRREYRDLWVIRFDADERCSSFEEWPFWPGQGPYAPG